MVESQPVAFQALVLGRRVCLIDSGNFHFHRITRFDHNEVFPTNSVIHSNTWWIECATTRCCRECETFGNWQKTFRRGRNFYSLTEQISNGEDSQEAGSMSLRTTLNGTAGRLFNVWFRHPPHLSKKKETRTQSTQKSCCTRHFQAPFTKMISFPLVDTRFFPTRIFDFNHTYLSRRIIPVRQSLLEISSWTRAWSAESPPAVHRCRHHTRIEAPPLSHSHSIPLSSTSFFLFFYFHLIQVSCLFHSRPHFCPQTEANTLHNTNTLIPFPHKHQTINWHLQFLPTFFFRSLHSVNIT